MLLQRIFLRGLQFLPYKSLSYRKGSKLFMFLSDRHSRGFADNVETNILDSIDVQKYVKYLINHDRRKKYNSEETEQLQYLVNETARVEEEIKNLEKMSSDGDKELEKLIDSEKKGYLESMKQIKKQIMYYIVPEEDDNDNRNIELRIASGIGGDEAKVFSKELFNMYMNYADFKNWEYEGDIENGRVMICGDNVFGHLKHEAGVHRVQRVPGNDPLRRIHSSTCSVLVFPQPKPHEIKINDKDLIVEKIKSSGPGGQNVNKRETCVRIKHIPTGIIVENQTSRFQFDNLKIAITRLRGILFNREQEKIMLERKTLRKEQAGSNDYSDKIRTYNFPQNRVTDHRINQSMQNLKGFLLGGKELDGFIQQVRESKRKNELIWSIRTTLESEEYKAFERQETR